MMARDDAELLRRLQAGEDGAQQELFQRCQVRLGGYFQRKLPNPGDTEDCVSEVFIRAMEGIRKGNRPQVLDAWLIGIAKNVLVKIYEQAKYLDGREIPADLPQQRPTEPYLTLGQTERTDEDLPELPTDVELVLGKLDLWALVLRAIQGISLGLAHIMETHFQLSQEYDREVVGAELAKALGMPVDRVYRQLDRARDATREAVAALVLVTRTGPSNCPALACRLGEILSAEQRQAGTNLALEARQSSVVLKHATGCDACGPQVSQAREYGRWALPGLVGLAQDDDERRRAAFVFFSRAGGGSPGPPPAVVLVAVPSSVSAAGGSDGPIMAPVGPVASLMARMARVPGLNPVVRLATEYPVALRAAAVGVVGILTAAFLAADSLAPTEVSPATPPTGPIAAPTAPAPTETGPGAPTTAAPAGAEPATPTTTLGSDAAGLPAVANPPSSSTPSTPSTTGGPAAVPDPGGGNGRSCDLAWQTVAAPNPDDDFNILTGTSASAQDDIWAVGYVVDYDYATGQYVGGRAMVQHWDGHAWTLVPTPNPGLWNALDGVAAPSRSMAWAVGYTSPDRWPRQTLVQRWDGRSWAQVSSPNPGSQVNSLYDVWAPTTNEAWAVGYFGSDDRDQDRALVLHWDGTAWTQVPTPPTSTRTMLWSVSGSGPNDVWAIGTIGPEGRLLIEHWDGTTWRIVPSPEVFDHGFENVTARSATDAWAVGGKSTPWALRWDGRAWSIAPTPDVGAGETYFTDVVALSERDVWVFGRRNYTDPGTGSQLIEHWNGSSWSVVSTPGTSTPGGVLEAALAFGPDEIWAVGHVRNADKTFSTLTQHGRC